ncbi:baseplate assembly protein [Bordetella sp. H567]|uniref:baseplate assembly protein n=1 Tax=Bordetella sp. H567 TaxID=1697043 RepID=UPI00081C6320|nr:baseplate J/gp47 family protein [Bordetella sp. H567]AOB29907.1 baseplate assembly protein [Bordetella sp. H567]
MAAASTPIDLSLLPVPDVVETLDYETILATRKADLLALCPVDMQPAIAAVLALESEPLTILLQENALRELTWRQRVNEACRAVLVATAVKADLDNLAARHNVTRLLVSPGDDTAYPPVPAIYETDDSLRQRVPEAFEGMSVAGPRGAYLYHARSADGAIADVSAVSPTPCQVVVSVLSREGDGTASADLLAKVDAALDLETIRPLADEVIVQSSEIVPFQVKATLYLRNSGPGQTEAVNAAISRVQAFVSRAQRQGASVWRTQISALLHVEGVSHLDLEEPAADIVLTAAQAATCTDVIVTAAVDTDNG